MRHYTDNYRKELAKLDKATKELHKTNLEVKGEFSLQQLIDGC